MTNVWEPREKHACYWISSGEEVYAGRGTRVRYHMSRRKSGKCYQRKRHKNVLLPRRRLTWRRLDHENIMELE